MSFRVSKKPSTIIHIEWEYRLYSRLAGPGIGALPAGRGRVDGRIPPSPGSSRFQLPASCCRIGLVTLDSWNFPILGR